jgi:hypothetical protein
MQKLLESVDVLAISEHWLYADELTILDNLHNDFLYYAKTSEQNNMNTRWKRGQGASRLFGKNISRHNDYYSEMIGSWQLNFE